MRAVPPNPVGGSVAQTKSVWSQRWLASKVDVTNQSAGKHGPEGFTRDRMTILAYGMAMAFGYGVAAMGPAMPLMREDLDISRTVGGLHFTALATGAVIAGFVADR